MIRCDICTQPHGQCACTDPLPQPRGTHFATLFHVAETHADWWTLGRQPHHLRELFKVADLLYEYGYIDLTPWTLGAPAPSIKART